jgi:hypothetical protein
VIVLAPWLFALGAALLLDAVNRTGRSEQDPSIVASFSAFWAKEPAVVRAYGQEGPDGLLLILECVEPPLDVPGEFSGRPVRVRVLLPDQEPGPAEKAAREASRLYPCFVRADGSGRLDQVSAGERTASITVAGCPSPEEARQIAASRGVLFRTAVLGPETLMEFARFAP